MGDGRGKPRPDLISILSLLPHDLNDDEVMHVASRLAVEWGRRQQPVTDADIRTVIEKEIYQPADEHDIAMVRAVLQRSGYPLSDTMLDSFRP